MLFLILGADMARPSRTGGKKSEAKARNASPAKGRKTTKTKPRIAPAATRVKRRSVSGPSKDLKEAREQQAATAEILKVIASSPDDVQPVFEAIVANADRLIGGFSTTVYRFVGSMVHLATFTPINPAADELLKNRFPCPIADRPNFALAQAGETVEIPDTEVQPDLPLIEIARARGIRSLLYSPLMSKGTAIGVILVTRRNPGPFSPHHVELLRTFADQAVIAIENVRLFNEVQVKTRDLTVSLQQQTATADVLKVISRSAFDLGSVMNTLTHSAAELCKAEIGALYLHEGDVLVARGVADVDSAQADFLRRTPLRNDSSTYVGRTILAGAIRNIADVASEREIGLLKRFSEVLGFRSILFVPLMREGRGIGVFALARQRTGQFSQRDVDLVQTFADQAVIAIENVRLFDEVQAKTRDLTEALTYQTGSSNILSVIASSPTDVGPALKAIVESACELCDAYDAAVVLQDGEYLRISAHHGPIPIGIEKGRSAVARPPAAGSSTRCQSTCRT